MEKLKPCPFCGCHPMIRETDMTNDGWDPATGRYFIAAHRSYMYQVLCPDCGCVIEFKGPSNTLEGAVAIWNRRVSDEK